MSGKIRIIAYVVLGGLALWLGLGFVHYFAHSPPPAPKRSASTNTVNLTTQTNTAGTTNAAALTNTAANAASADDTEVPLHAGEFDPHRMRRIVVWGLGFVLALAGLAILIAHDFSHFVGERVGDFIFNDKGEGIKNPEYEHAEDVWANGSFLEAIQLMRDYLKEHPREQYVALRIAEIYEKDLNHFLAAALEYEEILKKSLPPERWGWAAVHLANLYSGKLNKVKPAEELLHRIVNEYGQTAAAKKARERLGIPEPVVEAPPEPEPEAAPTAPAVSLEQQMADLQEELMLTAPPEAVPDEPDEPAEPPSEPGKPESKLPPGFRPKSS